MGHFLHQYPAWDTDNLSPEAVAHIERFATRTKGSRTCQGIVNRVRRGEWQLWQVVDDETYKVIACVGTALFIWDDGRRACDVVFCAGYGLLIWGKSVRAELEEWAASGGCTIMNIIARRGMIVILDQGYRSGAVEFQKEI